MTAPPRSVRPAAIRGLCSVLIFAALCSATAAQPPAADAPVAVGQIYQQAKRACVEILVDDHLAGTGTIVAPKGVVLTAAHLLGQPEVRVEVLSPELGRVEAKLLAVDLGHDLLLLSLPERENGYPALGMADKRPTVGERVYGFGTPIFRHRVLQPGMIARDDDVYVYYPGRYVEATHVAAMVQGGTSGGPWIDEQGRVVGVQSGTMRDNNAPAGIAKVIPLKPIRALLDSRRNAATATFGAAVEELWQHNHDTLKRFPPKTEALVLRQIQKDGPAARAGLKEWDAVTAADGNRVRLSGELLRIVRAKKPGDTLKLDILRPDGAGTRQVELKLGCLEVNWPNRQ